MTNDKWHVIGRGLNGWHAKGINVSSSGGTLEPVKWWAGGMTRGYLQDAIEGCLVYDAEQADPDAFAKLIISGPMVNPALEPDAVNAFTDRSTAERMAPGLSGAFQTIASLATVPTYSGLDYVGVNIYRGLLSAVPGIKLGTVRDGAIVWG